MKHIPDTIYEKFILRIKPILPIINKEKKILVAVSGGPDSMFLLFLMTKFAIKNKIEIIPVYINHKVRPRKEIKKDINAINKFCKDNNLVLQTAEINPTKSDENTLRKLRYEKLISLAKKFRCSVIATGHTLNDAIETFFLNLVRGSGIKGLCGTPALREIKSDHKTFYIVRPIIDIPKDLILDVLEKLNINYSVDITNLKLFYNRNFLRNKILPLFKQINPNFEKNILSTITLLNNTYEIFNNLLEEKINNLVRYSGAKLRIDLRKFLMYNEFIKSEILYRIIGKLAAAHNLNFRAGYKDVVNKILQFLNTNENTFDITKKINLKKTKAELIITVK
ncbi:MAG: tRNA lysidine(34) synthetase TilS [Endomicrobia bacterium]|nr:tRNA lysidine(34) synthetase TilS [Endomicrobiia bacterium]